MVLRIKEALRSPRIVAPPPGTAPRPKGLTGKQRERLLLEKEFKPWYRGFPRGEIRDHECPDFLVKVPYGYTFGIEVSEVYRAGGVDRKEGSPYREQEGLREKLVKTAEGRYYELAGRRPAFAHFTWPPLSVNPPPLDGRLARELGAVAGENVARRLPDPGFGRLELGAGDLAGTPLPGVLESIEVHESHFFYSDGRGSPWGHVTSYVPATLGVADLERAIASKDAKAERYRESCNELWLLLLVTGMSASSFGSIDEAILSHRFSSSFERVTLLFMGEDPNLRVLTLVGPQQPSRGA